MAGSTTLPRIPNCSSMPGLVYLPGVTQRNPISGKVVTYESLYADPERNRGKNKYGSSHKNIHELSVFESTGYQRSYFIIHPQWTSESAGAKRLSTRERGYHSWDCRPSVPAAAPITHYLAPVESSSTARERLLQESIAAQNKYEADCGAVSQRSRRFKPVTPTDGHGNVMMKYSYY